MEEISVDKVKQVNNDLKDRHEQEKGQKRKQKKSDFDRMYKAEIKKLQQSKSIDSSSIQQQYELERMKILNSRVYNRMKEKKANAKFREQYNVPSQTSKKEEQKEKNTSNGKRKQGDFEISNDR